MAQEPCLKQRECPLRYKAHECFFLFHDEPALSKGLTEPILPKLLCYSSPRSLVYGVHQPGGSKFES
eukprot:1151906-Pelagomonas_calceolata.AAC.2